MGAGLRLKQLDSRAHVLIVGLGLIGGSYAKALTKQGFSVRAVTKEQADIAYAVREGFLAGGSTEAEPALFAWADLVVLALYPHTLLAGHAGHGCYRRQGRHCGQDAGTDAGGR